MLQVWTLPPPSQACRVESLRLVPAKVVGALPADCPIPGLFITVTLAVTSYVVVARALQGVPANYGIHSSRFGFFPREAPIFVLKSVALPTELPGQRVRTCLRTEANSRLSNSLRVWGPRAKPAPSALNRIFWHRGSKFVLRAKIIQQKACRSIVARIKFAECFQLASKMGGLKGTNLCRLELTRIVKEAGRWCDD